MKTKEIISVQKYKELAEKYNKFVVLKPLEDRKTHTDYNNAWFVLKEIKEKYILNERQTREVEREEKWLNGVKKVLHKYYMTEQPKPIDNNIFDTNGLS